MAGKYRVRIDWAKKNGFDGQFDDISDRFKSIDFELGMGRVFQSVADETRCSITVINSDGRFNPENTSSPYAGYMVPYRPIRIEWVDDEVQYADGDNELFTDGDGVALIEFDGSQTLWSGWSEGVQPKWEPAAESTGITEAVITGHGAKKLLQDTNISLPLYTDTTEDVIIKDIIGRTQLPPAGDGVGLIGIPGRAEIGQNLIIGSEADLYIVDEGLLDIPFYGDKTAPNAFEAISELVISAGGRFYFDRQGRAVYWNRHYLTETLSVSGTVSSTGTYKPQKVDYGYGRHISTEVRVRAHPRQTDSASTLWQLENPVTIAPGETKTFEATLRRSDGEFTGAQNLTITNETYSLGSGFATVKPKGGKAILRVENNSSTQKAILSDLSLTGASIQNQNQIETIATDTDAVAEYGKRNQISLDLPALQDLAEAERRANWELQRRNTPFGDFRYVEFTVEQNSTNDDFLLNWGMGTRLTLNFPELEHENKDHYVIGERWHVEHNVTRKMLILEPHSPLHDFMVIGTGVIDTDRIGY